MNKTETTERKMNNKIEKPKIGSFYKMTGLYGYPVARGDIFRCDSVMDHDGDYTACANIIVDNSDITDQVISEMDDLIEVYPNIDDFGGKIVFKTHKAVQYLNPEKSKKMVLKQRKIFNFKSPTLETKNDY